MQLIPAVLPPHPRYNRSNLHNVYWAPLPKHELSALLFSQLANPELLLEVGELLPVVWILSPWTWALYSQEFANEQDRSHKSSAKGPDLVSWSLDPSEANRALFLSGMRIESLRHAELQGRNDSVGPENRCSGTKGRMFLTVYLLLLSKEVHIG
jgi:hypothetical protein